MSKETNGEINSKAKNILKCRDDVQPVIFTAQVESTGEASPQFVLDESVGFHVKNSYFNAH